MALVWNIFFGSGKISRNTKNSLHVKFAKFMLSTAIDQHSDKLGSNFFREDKNCHSFPTFMKIDERAFVMYTELWQNLVWVTWIFPQSKSPMALDHREMAGPCKYCAQNDVSGTRLLFPNMRGMIYDSKTRQWKISRYADKHCDHHHYHHHQGHLNFSWQNLGNLLTK